MRKQRHARHRRIVHARHRDPEGDRREDQRRAPSPAGRQPERQPGGRDRNAHARRHVGGRVDHVGAGMQRRHADVMHREDARPHQAGRQDQAQRRQGSGAGGVDRGADHDDANQKRQERRENQVVDRERKAGGQHPDEMHGPDSHPQRKGRSRQQQAPSHSHGVADLHGQAQADIRALDGHDDRKRDKPRLVRHRHRRDPFLACERLSWSEGWDEYKSKWRRAKSPKRLRPPCQSRPGSDNAPEARRSGLALRPTLA